MTNKGKITKYNQDTLIKVIAFDFGGVIYTYNHDILMKDIAKELKQSINMVINAWKTKIKQYEKGEISENEFWDCLLKKLNIRHDKKILHQIVIKHFKPIYGSLKILADLQDKRIIGLISNQTSWIEDLERIYKFKKSFDILVVSKDVSLRKPNKNIFKLFIKKTKANPEEIIFIDDSISYKEATESTGMNFIHFKNPKQLRIELKTYGIKL